ncbi:MAG: UDP-3-O-acyl-N-acetylglucosamine deacetylase [Candidatus Omnitrophica bacterium]|nr:UDP-3-O-acyl-N-acetylglucosamine deacetylase [Candidatus Omnitrophota bacterium]
MERPNGMLKSKRAVNEESEKMKQNTIEKEVVLEGIGIHSGQKVTLKFLPAKEDQGIVFRRTDLSPVKEISIKNFVFGKPERCTVITNDGAQINTVEHLMASLWALQIDNIIIEIDNIEVPGLDGSAMQYYEAVKRAGRITQEAKRKQIKIKEPVFVNQNNAFIGLFPSDVFSVSYLLEHKHPAIGKQYLSLELTPEIVVDELIFARTFCLKEEAEMLQKMGYGKGANTKNTLVMDVDGPMENVLRFSDELVRHKMLDLVGDMYLTNYPIIAKVVAVNSGHAMNMEIIKQIKKIYC